MNLSTDLTRRNETVKRLTDHGFRVQFLCDDFVLLCKPKAGCMLHMARVDNGGYVNTQTLSDFLNDVLNIPPQELITE